MLTRLFPHDILVGSRIHGTRKSANRAPGSTVLLAENAHHQGDCTLRSQPDVLKVIVARGLVTAVTNTENGC